MHIQTEGLVLRETAYLDSDKMLTILTRDEGKLSVRARGARRRGSSLLAATQILSFAEYQLFKHNGRYQMDDAEILDLFFRLRQSFQSFALASYCAELMDSVCVEGEPHEDVLRLGVLTCRALEDGRRSADLVKAAFELRLMSILGFEPHLSNCGVCGAGLRAPCFHPQKGISHCSSCAAESLTHRASNGKASGHCRESIQLTPGAYDAMRHIVGCELKRLFAFALEQHDAEVLSVVSERYVLAQTERGYAALDYYHSISGK